MDEVRPERVLLVLFEWISTAKPAELLSAPDLCAMCQACKACQALAESTPAFWWQLVWSGCQSPPQFFVQAAAQQPRFAAVNSIKVQFCNGLTDAHLSETTLPPALRQLNLDGCHEITDAGIKAIAATCGRRLESLSLYWNMKVTDAAALTLALRCGPSLRHLCLSGCQKMSSTGILSLASRCNGLTSLDMTRLPNVDDTALAAIVQAQGAALRELRVFACSQYTDVPILALARHCPHLTALDCTGLRHLSDAGLVALAEGCRELSTAIFSWATRLTDEAVIALALGCGSRLRTLSLHGLTGVSAERGLAALAQGCASSLVELDVRGCVRLGPELTRADGEALREMFPRLRNTVVHKG